MTRKPVDGLREWQSDPTVTGVNRLPQRATFYPFESQDEARRNSFLSGGRTLSLNGTWQFLLCDEIAAKPQHFYEIAAETDGWSEIAVPSSWQMQGFGQAAYCNIQYPWEGVEKLHPPFAPTQSNSVGLYRKTVTIEESFLLDRLILTFEGVESCFYLYVNGERVGYSEGTFRRSEFDVTDLVHPGENLIAVEVYRWCTGSWLEDQDFFRLAGIFRDVYLSARPAQYLADIAVSAEPDARYRDGGGDDRLRYQWRHSGV